MIEKTAEYEWKKSNESGIIMIVITVLWKWYHRGIPVV